MCGICGAVGFDRAVGIAESMNRAMIHRGPDSGGFVDDGTLALGIRRLRIIDLNTGDQPIFNEDGTVAVVLNGEIYNFTELRKELAISGHSFTTGSDTEVIVHAYEEWGIECVKHLRGMFAFAVWDGRPWETVTGLSVRRVLLARDRLGIKPLYIWRDKGRFLFASEVRAILNSGICPRRLSAAGVYTYLASGSVQEPLTIIDGITAMPPGSWLQVELSNDRWTETSGVYWQPAHNAGLSSSPADVFAWLADAVQSHLISEVPLGSFLSGGLDSGAIVALASRAQEQPTRTFTLAFDDWPHDERDRATLTARRFHSVHQTRVISQTEVLADLPDAIAAMDQPTADGINTWYVSREAKRAGLTVALSGVGGDELFAGYASFRKVALLKRIQLIGRFVPKSLTTEKRLSWLPSGPDGSRKLSAFLRGDTPFNHPYFCVRGLFPPSEMVKLLRPEVGESLSPDCDGLRAWRSAVESDMSIASSYDSVGETSWLELSQYMRSTLLRDTDTMSMAHSLEVRVPFVDHVLVDRVLSIKGQRKLRGSRSKPLLVDGVGSMLPREIVESRKRTFTFPFEQWLNQELSSPVSHCLQNLTTGLTHLVDPASTKQVWREFVEGRTNWARPWALYVLDAWTRCNT